MQSKQRQGVSTNMRRGFVQRRLSHRIAYSDQCSGLVPVLFCMYNHVNLSCYIPVLYKYGLR